MTPQGTLPAGFSWVPGGGSIGHAPLPYDDVLRLCRGVALGAPAEALPETWQFSTPEHAALFAETMAGRGWHFGQPTFIPRKMFPRHNITLIGGPA